HLRRREDCTAIDPVRLTVLHRHGNGAFDHSPGQLLFRCARHSHSAAADGASGERILIRHAGTVRIALFRRLFIRCAEGRNTAREKFTQVLQIDPHNSSAQEYMEKLSEVVTEGGAAAFVGAYTPPPSAAKPEIFSDMAIERQTAETPLAPPTIAPPPRKPPST